jgi:hypothetical protein
MFVLNEPASTLLAHLSHIVDANILQGRFVLVGNDVVCDRLHRSIDVRCRCSLEFGLRRAIGKRSDSAFLSSVSEARD